MTVKIDRETSRIEFIRQGVVKETYALDEPWLAGYFKCTQCHKPVPDDRVESALDSNDHSYCSDKCAWEHLKNKHACCSLAEFNECSCRWSCSCPEHGLTHVGVH